jgi:hypothetical protein
VQDQLELVASVVPRLTDQVRLDVQVFCNRVADPVLLEVQVTPLVTDRVLLLANVVNQGFAAEAQGEVLAPTPEIASL